MSRIILKSTDDNSGHSMAIRISLRTYSLVQETSPSKYHTLMGLVRYMRYLTSKLTKLQALEHVGPHTGCVPHTGHILAVVYCCVCSYLPVPSDPVS